jgi:hypothetical protein
MINSAGLYFISAVLGCWISGHTGSSGLHRRAAGRQINTLNQLKEIIKKIGAPSADLECGASWTAVALYLPPKAELFGWA